MSLEFGTGKTGFVDSADVKSLSAKCAPFESALLKVEHALQELWAVCPDEQLKRETLCVLNAYSARRMELLEIRQKAGRTGN